MSVLVSLALVMMAELPPVGAPLLSPPPLQVEAPPVGTPLITLLPMDAPTDSAAASPSTPSTSSTVATAATSQSDARRPWVGATLDAGIPEGFGASVVVLPFRWLRVHASVVTNTANVGVRGGLTIVPFRYYIVPVIGGELGHMFDGDLTATVQTVLGNTKLPDGLFKKVNYDFYTAYLGVEIGAPDRFIVYLRGGISRVNASLQGVVKQVNSQTQLDPGELKVGLTIPSAKAGVLLYF